MRARTIALALGLSHALSVRAEPPVYAEGPALLRGDFERGTEPCYGLKLREQRPTRSLVTARELVAHETEDTWDGSAGALRITTAREPTYRYDPQQTGVLCTLERNAPPSSVLAISFAAKSVGAPGRLLVARFWTGATASVPLSTVWERHVVYVPVSEPTYELVFNQVSEQADGSATLAEGELLIDELDVRVLEGPP